MSREMKHSDVKWLQEIPYSWDTIKGKNFLDLRNRPVRESDEVITCFRDGEVVLRSERRTDGFTMSDKEIGYQGINKGDIVIHGMDGFAGAMGISKSTGKGSPVLVVCNPKGNDVARYIVYYLRCLAMTDVFLALATGIRERSCDLRWKKIAELPFLRPTTAEQKKIADYLDKECGYIDEMVALQEQMIEELKAYKQSVITEAITKGINPDVPMRLSGIDWIGEIPEHWKICKVKHCLKQNKNNLRVGPFGSSLSGNDFKSEGYWVYNQRCVIDNNFTSNDTFVDEEKYNELKSFEVLPGDILITTRGSIGKVAVVPEDAPKGILHPCIIRFNIDNSVFDVSLLQHIFNESDFVLRQMRYQSNSTTIDVLYSYALKNIILTLPPLSEQHAIASYLDEKCSEIDSLIAIKQTKIEELKEYKKSIIYEYVTGKKEVPYGE